MWDNLGVMRDIISDTAADEFFIIGLDQKKAFHFISRGNLWEVLKAHGFEQDFIDIVRLLYAQLIVD